MAIVPLPASERALCLLVSYLADRKIRHNCQRFAISIFSRAAATHLLLSLASYHTTFAAFNDLKDLLTTASVAHYGSQTQRSQRPWSKWCSIRDITMLWAACRTEFFGFLRAEEFTAESLASFDEGVRITLRDVIVDCHLSYDDSSLAEAI